MTITTAVRNRAEAATVEEKGNILKADYLHEHPSQEVHPANDRLVNVLDRL